ncbi:MAG: hypothetical protein ACK5N0_08160 [Synechococcaceae cyanobacterium]
MRYPQKRCLLGLLLAIASSQPDLAQAAPSYGSKSITIPIVHPHQQGQFLGSPHLGVAFGNSVGFTDYSSFLLDTGSTGIAVSRHAWDPTAAGAQKQGPGSIIYSSSGKKYTGDWYSAVVRIGQSDHYAEASVPVLFVNNLTCLPNHAECQENNDPALRMFGVGFARASASDTVGPNGKVAAVPTNNPLLNITGLNGTSVKASTPAKPGATGIVGDFTSGYILSRTGLTLGLTPINTAAFAKLLALDWSDRTQDSGFDSGYADWNPVPATLTVNGTTGHGGVLTDTGLSYMFVTPASGAVVQVDNACDRGHDCLAPGTTVTVGIDTIVSYQFTIGPSSGEPIQPAPPAAPPYAVKADGSVFVNTGSQFFGQYIYLYDYVNGQVGYIDRQTLDGYPSENLIWLADAFSPAPVPASLPLAGAAVAYSWSRQLRRRLRRASL